MGTVLSTTSRLYYGIDEEVAVDCGGGGEDEATHKKPDRRQIIKDIMAAPKGQVLSETEITLLAHHYTIASKRFITHARSDSFVTSYKHYLSIISRRQLRHIKVIGTYKGLNVVCFQLLESQKYYILFEEGNTTDYNTSMKALRLWYVKPQIRAHHDLLISIWDDDDYDDLRWVNSVITMARVSTSNTVDL